jgi:hypothetical protein
MNYMMNWNRFWRRMTAFMLLRTPMLSYGELVLRPVTIAERAAGTEIAFSTAHNKK